MPVSSLVVHLSAEAELSARALADIRTHAAFLAGEQTQLYLPLSLVTESERENKACWRWLSSLPGVEFVEVLNVVFSPAPPSDLVEERTATSLSAGS
ncbi:MAG TPA: hypothetical protein DEA08_38050 [Planctomycetes bacterium]|nr:hypothetical protein [Planctomycetota bacterium]